MYFNHNPNGMESGFLEGEIVEGRDIFDAQRNKMLQFVDGESIRAWGGRVFVGVEGRTHMFGCERSCVGFQSVFSTDAP